MCQPRGIHNRKTYLSKSQLNIIIFIFWILYIIISNSEHTPQSASTEPVPSTSGHQETILLKEICPDATDVEIQGALDASNGNANDAVGRLLGCFS
jgi:hypothetical protein